MADTGKSQLQGTSEIRQHVRIMHLLIFSMLPGFFVCEPRCFLAQQEVNTHVCFITKKRIFRLFLVFQDLGPSSKLNGAV